MPPSSNVDRKTERLSKQDGPYFPIGVCLPENVRRPLNVRAQDLFRIAKLISIHALDSLLVDLFGNLCYFR